MVLYECLTGKRLDAGQDRESAFVSAVVSAKMVLEFSADLEISPELQRICTRCLEPNPMHRYATALEVVAALRRVGPEQNPLQPYSLAAWRFGLLFGKFSRYRSYFQASLSAEDATRRKIAALHAFGLQETLNDLRKSMASFSENASEADLVEYPFHASEEIRKHFYDASKLSETDGLSELVDALNPWLHSALELTQGVFDEAGIAVLALFEFGFLAEQAIGAFGSRDGLQSVAAKTELPVEIYEAYCSQVSEPETLEQKELELLFQQLTKKVERHLLFGESLA